MLKLENALLKENNIEIFETKRFDKLIYNAMVKTEFETYRKIVAAEKVNITLDRCRVFDVTRIMRCLGYNHKSTECRNDETCYKLHGQHKTRECNKEIIKKNYKQYKSEYRFKT